MKSILQTSFFDISIALSICRVLIPGEDWQHGEIKLSLVFYPDESIDKITEFTESSLDEIRKAIVEISE
jgi:KGK domain